MFTMILLLPFFWYSIIIASFVDLCNVVAFTTTTGQQGKNFVRILQKQVSIFEKQGPAKKNNNFVYLSVSLSNLHTVRPIAGSCRHLEKITMLHSTLLCMHASV